MANIRVRHETPPTTPVFVFTISKSPDNPFSDEFPTVELRVRDRRTFRFHSAVRCYRTSPPILSLLVARSMHTVRCLTKPFTSVRKIRFSNHGRSLIRQRRRDIRGTNFRLKRGTGRGPKFNATANARSSRPELGTGFQKTSVRNTKLYVYRVRNIGGGRFYFVSGHDFRINVAPPPPSKVDERLPRSRNVRSIFGLGRLEIVVCSVEQDNVRSHPTHTHTHIHIGSVDEIAGANRFFRGANCVGIDFSIPSLSLSLSLSLEKPCPSSSSPLIDRRWRWRRRRRRQRWWWRCRAAFARPTDRPTTNRPLNPLPRTALLARVVSPAASSSSSSPKRNTTPSPDTDVSGRVPVPNPACAPGPPKRFVRATPPRRSHRRYHFPLRHTARRPSTRPRRLSPR